MTPTLKNNFLTFDPSELKNKLIERLNQGKTFTDQNYEGSNLSALIDIISYSFSTLLFYLSKTSSENMFSEAQIYENMNRIVKMLHYNPIGRVTSSVPFNLYASSSLSKNTYIIPRFSYINIGSSTYTLTTDLAFSKLTDEYEAIQDINSSYLLHQGSIEEYPSYIALGIENEIIYLATDASTIIDHFNIFVYVKPENGHWEEWQRTDNLALCNPTERKYEIRFNHNKRYEILFGDNVNGVKLSANDTVAIFYLKIDSNAAPLGPHSIKNQAFCPLNSLKFVSILSDTQTSFGSYLNSSQLKQITTDNEFAASDYSPEESVEDMRSHAPKVFRSQHRLVIDSDYEYFIKSNFKNLISDCKVVNNDTYLTGHLKYLYDIGLKNPHTENQILFNQVKFANSCNFNNIYTYLIPKSSSFYLSSHQKEYILKELSKYKSICSQVVPIDPEYMYFDFALSVPDKELSTDDIYFNILKIYKTPSSRRSSAAIKQDVISTILNTFSKQNLSIGKSINAFQLTTDILAIDGVKNVQTARRDSDLALNEISLLVWNAKYPKNDIKTYTQTAYMDYFKFPVLYNAAKLDSRIEIVDSSSIKIADF